MHEQQPQPDRSGEPTPAPRRWEAEPPGGPAVLIVSARMLDDGLGHIGGWLHLDQPTPAVAERLGEIIGTNGRPEDYVIVDQTGLGNIAWDEDEVAGLLSLTGPETTE